MNTMILNQIEDIISRLTLDEQLRLVEWLTHRIRQRTLLTHPFAVSDLAAMAADPEIQAELRQIEAEFARAEADGLELVAMEAMRARSG